MLRPSLRRGGFRHREAGDPGRDPDVRGPAALRGRRKVPGRATSATTRWAAACWAPPRASGPCRWPRCGRTSSAATARATSSWPAAGPDRLRRPGRRPPRRPAATGSGATTPRWSSRPGRNPASSRSPRSRPRSNTSCNWPRGPTPRAADRYAAKLLAIVLGDDSGSRLYWELVDPGLAEQCELNHHEYEGAGIFVTFMSCARKPRRKTSARSPTFYRRAAGRGHHPRRTGTGQEQGPLADGAFQRAAPRAAVFRGQRLDLSPRVSPGGGRTRHHRRPGRGRCGGRVGRLSAGAEHDDHGRSGVKGTRSEPPGLSSEPPGLSRRLGGAASDVVPMGPMGPIGPIRSKENLFPPGNLLSWQRNQMPPSSV